MHLAFTFTPGHHVVNFAIGKIMHIGLIGGIGPKATTFYYERIAKAFAAAAKPLSLTIAHTELALLAKNLMSNDKHAQAQEFQRVTQQLAGAGAERVAITSFGGSFCADEFARISPLPMMDGPSALVQHLQQAGLSRVGILGTTAVMSSKLYGKLDGVCECLSPADEGEDAMQQCHDDYRELAFNGMATEGQRSRLFGAAQRLCERGAQTVILGGTDLNVIFDGSEPVPVVDSAEVHVQAIVAEALRRG
jgi:aspartate racemase